MILLLVIALLAICLIILSTKAVVQDRVNFTLYMFIIVFDVFVLFASLMPIVVIDNDPGTMVGEVVGFKENIFGGTSIYLRNDNSEQKALCVENEEILNFIKENKGKTVLVGWGDRVGIYPLNKCHQAPIVHIERWED